MKGVKQAEKICRTILSPSSIPGMDYSINPYTGCAHACVYCYANYMQRYSGHTEPWGTFVDIKVNAPQILIRQLRRCAPSSIFMSSVTDPYQPCEKNRRITRRILEILAPLPHAISIHTKSALVERDIPLLKDFKHLSVTFTIVTGDEDAARCLEPGASTVAERLRVLERLAREGIRTAVFIGPIIPFVTERSIHTFLKRLAGAGVGHIMLDDLHYFSRIKHKLLSALRPLDPGIPGKIVRVPEDYYQQTGQIVLEFCHAHDISCSCFF